MTDQSDLSNVTGRSRLADIIAGRVPDRGVALIKMILNSPDEHRIAAINFLARSMESEKPKADSTDEFGSEDILLALLRAQRSLLSSSRERLHKELREISASLVPALNRMLTRHSGGDLHLLIEMAASFAEPELMPRLTPLLESDDSFTALLALQAISAIGTDDSTRTLVASLKDDELKWSAIALLADIKAKSSVGAVAHMLADSSTEVRLEAIRALVSFNDQRVLSLMRKVCSKDPDQRVRESALEAFKRISTSHVIPFDEGDLLAACTRLMKTDREIDKFLAEARVAGASDAHFVPGSRCAFRMHGEIEEVGQEVFDPETTKRMIHEILPDRLSEDLEKDLQVDFSYFVQGLGRHRVNVFHERRGIAAVIRLIPPEIPSLASLGLPPQVKEITSMQQGLVLVTGRSGSGKTTTLAALVNLLNETNALHIITLEDPIEYLHHRKRSLVNQREVGRHTVSFPAALRSSLREDPDVIVVGEMRDLTTMRLAVEAAETGHLVMGTLHTPDAVGAVERLVEAFPSSEQQQVRLMLADSLKIVIAQTLIRKVSTAGRVGCFEVLVCTSAVGNLIRDNKMNQIPGIMQTGKSVGMKTMDSALFELMTARSISPRDAYVRALNKDTFQKYVSKGTSEDR